MLQTNKIGLILALAAVWLVLTSPVQARKAGSTQAELVVDVRTPGEFRSGQVKGAINIPLSEVKGRASEFGAKDVAITVYCRSGRRSGIAKRILEDLGYSRVTNGGGLANMRTRGR